MQVRKVKISIRFKLIVLTSSLLFFSLSAYLFFALDLFQRDKEAYIFESGLSTVEALSFQVTSQLEQVLAISDLFQGESEERLQVVERLFDGMEAPVALSSFTLRGRKVRLHTKIFKEKTLKQYELSDEDVSLLLDRPPVAEIIQNQLFLYNASIPGKMAALAIGIYYPSKKVINHFVVDLAPLTRLFAQDGVYRNTLYLGDGSYIIHPDERNIFEKKSLRRDHYLADIFNSGLHQGVKELKGEEDKDMLVSFSKIPKLSMVVFSEIDKTLAYQATRILVIKSVLFAVFLLSLAIFLCVLLARSLSGPIVKLFEVTKKISDGNFKTQVEVKTHDEIGVLSDSFNFMSRKILSFIEEIKEKARMENELEVAKLVQSSFFPNLKFRLSGVEIAAFYEPASECGGDWWTCYESNGKVYMAIGDATGHGVPAALITATVHSSIHLLKTFTEIQDGPDPGPGKILELLNGSVINAGSKIMMTFFMAVYDPKTKELVYSNAGHNEPLVLKYQKGKEQTKDQIEPLLSEAGSRLGHKKEGSYKEERLKISENDYILFFTDGIVEGENPEGKQWGNRRFIKSYLSHCSGSAEGVVNGLVEDARAFYRGIAPDDDLTLFVAKFD